MPNEYDQITAFHYSAFRPSLHVIILQECLAKGEAFSVGLDVGCGTGQSSIALTNFCKNVIGIEPSEAMLKRSIPHPKVDYRHYNKKHFDFSDDSFDLCTFAGSLYYAKSQTVLDEVIRVTKHGSRIIIYDFELSLDVILEKMHLESTLKEHSHYDHEVNFDDLNVENIAFEKKFKNHVSLDISISNLSHLLLSSKGNYSRLLKSLGEENLYNKVDQNLQSIFQTEKIHVDAMTYSMVYRNLK